MDHSGGIVQGEWGNMTWRGFRQFEISEKMEAHSCDQAVFSRTLEGDLHDPSITAQNGDRSTTRWTKWGADEEGDH